MINGLVVQRGGHETYFSNLIPALGEVAPDVEFLLLHGPWQEALSFQLPYNFRRIIAGPRQRAPIQRLLFEYAVLPRIARQEVVDLAFSPVAAATWRVPCPTVVASRNPNPFAPLGDAGWQYRLRNIALRRFTRWAAQRASRVVFVSRYSRDAALPMLGVSPGKTRVVYHGVGRHFLERPPADARTPYHGRRPYLLTVSTIQPHKNYLRMLEAFGCVAGECDVDYVIAGAVGTQREFRRFQALIRTLNLVDRVHYVGAVPYERLPALYQQSVLFVLPSLLETFGHPLVEAMASRVPVVASRAASNPEILGPAAEYFDPEDVQDMADTLRRVLRDPDLRTAMVSRGAERIQSFSWAAAARQLTQLFEELAGSGAA